MPELLFEVGLVPLEHVRCTGPIHAERVERYAHLRTVERDSEDSHVPIARGDDLQGMRRIRQIECPVGRTDGIGPGPNPTHAGAVHEQIDGAPVRLLKIRKLDPRRGRAQIAPCPRSAAPRLDSYAEE